MGLETLLIAGLAAGAGIAGAKAISRGMNKGSDGQPPTPTPQPLPQAPDPAMAADKAQEAVRKRKAAQTQTVFTDPLGVSGQADIVRKTLTGQ